MLFVSKGFMILDNMPVIERLQDPDFIVEDSLGVL